MLFSLVVTQLALFIQTILATLRSNQSTQSPLLPLLLDAETTSALHTSTHTELGRAFRVLHLLVRLVCLLQRTCLVAVLHKRLNSEGARFGRITGRGEEAVVSGVSALSAKTR